MTNDTILHAAKWISLVGRRFTNRLGQTRDWEFVTRNSKGGAVGVIAILPSPARVVLVRQFRPPLGRHTIEFPAGLVDDAESPETAALRELAEETGLIGRVLGPAAEGYSSPGLTDEAIRLIRVEVIGEGVARPESDEDITVHHAPVSDLMAWLEQRRSEGDLLDAKVLGFALGLELSKIR